MAAPLERYAPISFTDEATAPALPTDIQKLAQAARPSSEIPAVVPPLHATEALTPAPVPAASTPSQAWDDHTAPALPSDIRQLAQAHAALAAGDKAIRDSTRSAEHPRSQNAPAEETSPAVPSARAHYSFADAEEETSRFTEDDLRELRLAPPTPGATNASELDESGQTTSPAPDLHPPSIVINEEAEAFRRRMDTLPPSSKISQSDIETQVKRAAKPPRRTGGALLMLLLAALVAAGAIALLLMRTGAPKTLPRPAPPKAATASTLPSATSSTKALPPPRAPTAPEPPAAPSDQASCVASHFPEATFSDGGPQLETLCTDKDPRRLAKDLHRKIVVGGQGKISAGMREWSLFSWYELAAIATIKHDCCASTDIELPESPVCESLGDSLSKVASTKDEAALSNLEDQIACLYDKQAPRPYRYPTRPDSGNKTAFKQFLERAKHR